MSEQQEAAPPQVSDEQIIHIKNALINQTLQAYQKFIATLRQLPAAQVARQQAFLSFDSGMLWMKEAIAAAKLEVKAVMEKEISPNDAPIAQGDQDAQGDQPNSDDAMCEAPATP